MIKNLVEPDRVHRTVYTDPALFELEMDRLFGRAWLLLGHASQAPRPGDYFTTRMGREPVVVVRHTDDTLHVLVNRCAHRGSRVCEGRGRAQSLVCPYHGWTYATDGALCGVPLPDGYDRSPVGSPDFALRRVPRVDAYRGFIFASLAADGPSLAEFLGPLRASFDDLVDRAPDGDIEVAGGVFKHAYRGNWKLVLENHNDAVHPAFVHASSIAAAREQAPAGATAYADIAIRQMLQNGAPWEAWERTGLRRRAGWHRRDSLVRDRRSSASRSCSRSSRSGSSSRPATGPISCSRRSRSRPTWRARSRPARRERTRPDRRREPFRDARAPSAPGRGTGARGPHPDAVVCAA